MKHLCVYLRNSGGVVVKLVACGARGPGFDFRPRRYNFRDWYLLLPSRNMAERSLKRRKSSNKPTNHVYTVSSFYYCYGTYIEHLA